MGWWWTGWQEAEWGWGWSVHLYLPACIYSISTYHIPISLDLAIASFEYYFFHIALDRRALFSSSFFPQPANRSAYPGSDITKLLQNKRSGVACTQTDYLVFGVRIESMRIFSPQLLTGFWGENRIYRDILTPVYKGRLSSFWGENRIYEDITTPVYTQVSGVRIE